MRIAQISPLYESVPPQLYGGTERVVSYLTEALVRQGHEVTLFASGDSQTAARLVPVTERSLRLDPHCLDWLAHNTLLLERAAQHADEFDVMHYHIDYHHFPLSRRLGKAQLTTLHGRLDIPDLQGIYSEYSDMPVVSISDSQRGPLPQAHWVGTVYHGLPLDLYPFSPKPDGYFAFIGRISREKRVDRAIEVAKRLGVPIRIAAKIDKADREYFDSEIAHLFDDPLVEYIGEIGEKDKAEFLGGARALLFLIDWPEPFGLAMIEAIACGTPVVAFRCGSVPEVLDDGVTGFLVDDMEGALKRAAEISALDRKLVRRRFEERFSSDRMASDYVRIYREVIAKQGGTRG